MVWQAFLAQCLRKASSRKLDPCPESPAISDPPPLATDGGEFEGRRPAESTLTKESAIEDAVLDARCQFRPEVATERAIVVAANTRSMVRIGSFSSTTDFFDVPHELQHEDLMTIANDSDVSTTVDDDFCGNNNNSNASTSEEAEDYFLSTPFSSEEEEEDATDDAFKLKGTLQEESFDFHAVWPEPMRFRCHGPLSAMMLDAKPVSTQYQAVPSQNNSLKCSL